MMTHLCRLFVKSVYLGEYNILVLNDIHYHPNYTFEESGCYLGQCLQYGKYGEDSPWDLIEAVVDRASKENQNVEAVVITGDFIRHGYTVMDEKKGKGLLPQQKWNTVKEMLSNTTQLIAKKFPGIPILPSFGNNDML